MWVDPHPRRVGTKIIRVAPQVGIKKIGQTKRHHFLACHQDLDPSLEHDGAAAAAAAYAADAGALDAWDAAMVDDVQRHSAENLNFTTMANAT